MKILKAEWENHPILGNLTLDFRLSDGSPSNTVIIAGENGIGKTAILSSLFEACNFEESKFLKKLEVFDETHNRIVVMTPKYYRRSNGQEVFKGLDMTFPDGRITEGNYSTSFATDMIGSNPDDPRNNGCAYSSAQSVYEVKKVENISSKDVDSESLGKSRKVVSPQFLKELLIDIETQDGLDYKRLAQEHPGHPIDYATFEPNSKMFRFKNAFNTFFDSGLEYDGIEKGVNQYDVIFRKNNRKISLSSLSTGECQIIFRGGQLLSNVRKINNGVIFIDEPETSMHPKWQEKILKYYKDIFSTSGVQTAQLIIATHSEGVVAAGMNKPYSKIIVLTRSAGGDVVEGGARLSVLPIPISAEVNYMAFDILSTDYHIALYARVQSISGEEKIKRIDQWIERTDEYRANPLPRPHSYTPSGSTQPIQYQTLPTYIRNQIDHPDPIPNFTSEEMRKSVDLLRKIIKNRP